MTCDGTCAGNELGDCSHPKTTADEQRANVAAFAALPEQLPGLSMDEWRYLVSWPKARMSVQVQVGALRKLLDEHEALLAAADEPTRCPVHADQEHGAEAEELRSGVERLLASSHGGGWNVSLLRRELRDLLDDVDARDSLAWLERRDAAKGEP